MSLSIGVSQQATGAFNASITTGAATPQASGSTFVMLMTGGSPTASDSVGNSYTSRGTFTINGGTRTGFWYDCYNATGAAGMTWTYAPSSQGECTLLVLEIATGAGSGLYPIIDSSAVVNSANTSTGASAAAAGGNEVALSCIFLATGSATTTINDSAGWNNILQSVTASSTLFCGALSAQAIASAGSYNDTYTVVAGGSSSGILTAIYKSSATAVSPPFWGQVQM